MIEYAISMFKTKVDLPTHLAGIRKDIPKHLKAIRAAYLKGNPNVAKYDEAIFPLFEPLLKNPNNTLDIIKIAFEAIRNIAKDFEDINYSVVINFYEALVMEDYLMGEVAANLAKVKPLLDSRTKLLERIRKLDDEEKQIVEADKQFKAFDAAVKRSVDEFKEREQNLLVNLEVEMGAITAEQQKINEEVKLFNHDLKNESSEQNYVTLSQKIAAAEKKLAECSDEKSLSQAKLVLQGYNEEVNTFLTQQTKDLNALKERRSKLDSKCNALKQRDQKLFDDIQAAKEHKVERLNPPSIDEVVAIEAEIKKLDEDTDRIISFFDSNLTDREFKSLDARLVHFSQNHENKELVGAITQAFEQWSFLHQNAEWKATPEKIKDQLDLSDNYTVATDDVNGTFVKIKKSISDGLLQDVKARPAIAEADQNVALVDLELKLPELNLQTIDSTDDAETLLATKKTALEKQLKNLSDQIDKKELDFIVDKRMKELELELLKLKDQEAEVRLNATENALRDLENALTNHLPNTTDKLFQAISDLRENVIKLREEVAKEKANPNLKITIAAPVPEVKAAAARLSPVSPKRSPVHTTSIATAQPAPLSPVKPGMLAKFGWLALGVVTSIIGGGLMGLGAYLGLPPLIYAGYATLGASLGCFAKAGFNYFVRQPAQPVAPQAPRAAPKPAPKKSGTAHIFDALNENQLTLEQSKIYALVKKKHANRFSQVKLENQEIHLIPKSADNTPKLIISENGAVRSLWAKSSNPITAQHIDEEVLQSLLMKL